MNGTGVLVMAYGGPDHLDDVEPYLLDVRGFRETPAGIVDDVRERYERIGGRSPILERTRAQAEALSRALRHRGAAYDVDVGMRHWHPYISDALARMAARGIRRAVGLVMAPHYSKLSIAKYYDAVEEADVAVEIAPVLEWHMLPGYLRALADRVRGALDRFPADRRPGIPLVFTAHSLPERITSWHDPYPEQLAATVRGVIELLGERPHYFAYQSAAMTRDPWLGPDVGQLVEDLAGDGVRDVIVAPIGFVSEHVEILYDIDIELQERARGLGVRVERIEMLNDHPEMIGGLADAVLARAREAGWR